MSQLGPECPWCGALQAPLPSTGEMHCPLCEPSRAYDTQPSDDDDLQERDTINPIEE